MDQFWMQEHTALMFFMGSLFNWEWSEEAMNWNWSCDKYRTFRSKFEGELKDGENGGIQQIYLQTNNYEHVLLHLDKDEN